MVPRQHRSTVTDQAAMEAVADATASRPLPFWRILLRRGGQLLIIALPLLLLLLFVLYPLAAIILQSIFPHIYDPLPNLEFSLEALTKVFSNSENYLAFFNSLWIGLVTALIACALGTMLAFLARRTDLPLCRSMDTLVWIVFFTPSFLLGEAWSLIFIRGGIPDQYFHFPAPLINGFFSPAGVIFILSLKSFPYVYLSVTAALHWLGSEFEDAARIVGARSWRAWLSINMPLLLPAILAAGLIVFAEALSDFGTAATIAQNSNVILVTYQIYTSINTSPVDFELAASLSLFLFIAIGLALLLQSAILRTRSFQVISGKNKPAHTLALGVWKWPATIFCIAVFVVALLIPLSMCLVLSLLHAFGQGLTANNWTLDNYTTVLANGSDDLDALLRTLWLALTNASVTALVGLPLAFIIKRTQIPGRRVLSLVTLLMIAVPGIILACGYIFAWNAPYLEYIGIGGATGIQFYGTVWVLLAAYVGGSLPYATRLGSGALDQIGQTMLETARVQGASLPQLLMRIVGPLLRSSLVSIWLLVFTGTMFELAASELLYPPGQPTMPVRIIALFDTFKLGPGMALAMLNIGLVTLALVVIRFLPWLARQAMQAQVRRKPIYVPEDQTTEQELRITTSRI
ncbi:ABC transporter permease [Ktedonobacter sp. SOSP1-85]|uniref:ABC transporter permease n=1 Tax=Ktedonobacter sp. SOSP1-85 TaxID=2778367 RepID=UPI0019167DE5|nr:iron ABC transporter permease [Ktedonobacter sp. SOSP1-85]GHO81796.1 ABC transporter permease [Ktedonobacter sp. SOSP1-85]